MTLPESATVTEPTIELLPPAPLHEVEIWSNPIETAARVLDATGVALPAAGRSAAAAGLTLIRFEPTVWLAEGDVAPLAAALGDDGAVTAIGGGIARVRLTGAGVRTLLMQGGVFDAESPGFATGDSAATVIDHVPVRLWMESKDCCLVYAPASYAAGLMRFWEEMRPLVRASAFQSA